jgi:hypothetical protein
MGLGGADEKIGIEVIVLTTRWLTLLLFHEYYSDNFIISQEK